MIRIREVGPRDGLQSEAPVPASERLALALRLAACGLREIEAASFVSPRAVPAMAGADEVFAGLAPGRAIWWALVPNARGAELARAAGASHLTLTVSATEAVRRLGDVAAAAEGAELDVVISCAFGSPFGDVSSVGDVARVVEAVRCAGPAAITLADTTGTATPRRITAVLREVGTDVGLHLHDTRGTALANALCAIGLGVTRFDTSVGGLGGSPFAPGAGGNLATEDLVLLLDDEGVETGVDLDALLDVSRSLADLVGHAVPSRTSSAGRLPRFEAVP